MLIVAAGEFSHPIPLIVQVKTDDGAGNGLGTHVRPIKKFANPSGLQHEGFIFQYCQLPLQHDQAGDHHHQ